MKLPAFLALAPGIDVGGVLRCARSVVVRAEALRFLASLKQPRWALPIWGWMIVGGAFYVIMTYGAAAMLQAREQGLVALVMIIAVMVTDGVWNYLLFRYRRLDWAYCW
ncbi:MAG: hypothetical protein E5Y67_09790 [Mesorhizobium sp.]|nr:MAG: hypothetical protein E5Y67_09790 [Mesorhizobium sp.]